MAKPKKKKEIVHLVCYCPRLRRHTLHVEKKK
jgi:ribosomal protein L33